MLVTCTYPGTMGYFEKPKWFLTWWMSVWQMPQYVTFTTTSSGPVFLLSQNRKHITDTELSNRIPPKLLAL
jgi:hypothetical protein